MVAEHSRHSGTGPAVPGDRRPPPRGFSLVELLMVVAILMLVVALGLPALQAARESARTSVCLNNMKQLGIAHAGYVGKYRTGMAAYDWRRNILPEMEDNRRSLICPGDLRAELYDINEYAVYIVNNKRTIPLEPGPWCANHRLPIERKAEA